MSEKTISLTNLARYKEDSDNLYAKQNGSYENMSVGNADNLTPYGDNSGVNDTTPFVFQSSGGGSDIGSLAQLKELRGNTIKWNQIISSPTTVIEATSTGGSQQTLIQSNIDLINGHKILITVKQDTTLTSNTRNTLRLISSDNEVVITEDANENANLTKGQRGWLVTIISSKTYSLYYWCHTPDQNVSFTNFNLFDLTEMFGAGNEPTSVVEFNRLFPKPYYAYDSGSLLSCKSSGYKVVGYNQLETQPTISYNTGYITGFIKVIAGQRYTFEIGDYQLSSGDSFGNMFFDEYDENQELIKSYNLVLNEQGEDSVSAKVTKGSHTLGNNTHYVKIKGYVASPKTITSISNCCLHLTWDESKTGYEEYKSQTYQLPNVVLRNARVSYDTLKPNGTLTRKVGVFDLGTLTTNDIVLTAQTTDYLIVTILPIYNDNSKKMNNLGGAILSDLKVNKTYKVSSPDAMYNKLGGSVSIAIAGPNAIYLRNDDLFTLGSATKEDVISALSGIVMQYGLLNEQESSVSTFVENTSIDNWGTQEFISSENIVVPQGCDFFYVVDYKAFIDSLGEREDINYDASKLVSQTELQTAIGQIPTGDFGFKKIPVPSSNTLTEEEYDTIVNSGAIIIGNFAGITNPVIFPPSKEATNYRYGWYFGGVDGKRYLCQYQINKTSREFGTKQFFIGLDDNNVVNFNGKDLPTYPNNPTVPQSINYDTDNTLKYMSAGFPEISAPTSTTLTDEQIAIISGGCRVNGTFLGLTNPVFFPTSTPNYNEITGFVYEGKGLGISLNIYSINVNNKSIIIYTGSQGYRVALGCVARLNGKGVNNTVFYAELSSSNIGAITTSTITTGWYSNKIAISGGLNSAIDVRVKMSNGAIYPAVNNNGTELVIFNGVDFTANNITVTAVYYKNL